MTQNTPSASTILTSPVHFLAFGFGSGLSPIAPGTVGTIVAVLLYLLSQSLDLLSYSLLTAGICITGVWLCGKSSELLGVHDHGGIVWDEFAGFFITMAGVSFSWTNLFIGFISFRVFDILKPWPVSLADKKLHGGFGVMLDDVIAALFSAGVIYIISLILKVAS